MSASALAEAAINVRRVEDRGDGVAETLIERQHTNYVPNNRDITAATMVAGSSVVTTADYVAGPDGAVLADRSNVSAGGYSRYDVAMPGGVGSMSLWVRRVIGAGSGVWQMSGGNTGGLLGKVRTISEMWERVVVPQATVLASNNIIPCEARAITATPDSTTAMGVDAVTDFLQWETSTYARSAIATAGAALACDPDDLSWAAGTWDTRLATSTWTVDIWPLFSSTDGATNDVRWICSFGAATDGVRLKKDATGWRVETIDASAAVAVSGYLTFSAHARLRITVEPQTSRVTVNGVSGGIAAALVWPTTGTLRLGGIAGAAVGSGEEVDARVARPFLGDGTMPLINTNAPLGDSITLGGASASNNGFKARVSALAVAAGVAYQNVGPYRTGTLADIQHAGVSGDTIAQMEARVVADVAAYRPRFTTIHAGTNDMGGTATAALAALRSLLIVHRAATGSKVVVCKIPPRTGFEATVNTFNAGLQAEITAAGYTAANSILVDPGVVAGELTDGVHPNDAGHDKIAAAVWAGLQALGAA